MKLLSVKEICRLNNIELKEPDGQPYCCGQRMDVRSGIAGPDYAKCEVCGKTIGNLASPHINGGFIPSDQFFKENPNGTWARIDTKAALEAAKEKHQ